MTRVSQRTTLTRSKQTEKYVPPKRDGYECVKYMRDVLDGKIVACQKIIRLCEIMLPRVESGTYKCWHYNPEKAVRPVRFIERFCCQPEGRMGQHITLEPFQLFVIELLFGFVDDNGYRQFNELLWVMGRKCGKALSLDTEIPTPGGWRLMRDVHVGDYVFGADGKPARVAIESEIFHKPMYEVTFEDGAVIKASSDHIWTVQTKKSREACRRPITPTSRKRPFVEKCHDGGWFEVTTEDMVDDYYHRRADGKGTEYKYRVPMQKPVEYTERELPIDPYLLGVWLGDGTTSKPEVTCGDEDIYEMMALLMERYQGLYAKKYPCRPDGAWTIKFNLGFDGNQRRLAPLRKMLERAGVLGNKHIPEEYLTASVDQRLELLKGLMDTDGTVFSNGECDFTQKSEVMADGFVELCASLGIKAKKRKRHVTCNGKDAGYAYTVTFFVDKEHTCFKLSRKTAKLKDRLASRMGAKSIVKIERIPNEPSKCIAIDNDSHLYLAGRQYTATHNTSISAALALYMLMKDGEFAPQCYSAATSKDQASLLYGSMMRMKNQSPEISKRLRKGNVVSRDCDGLICDYNEGYFTPLSSQTKSLDGLNVHFAAIDEVAAITDRDVYDLLKQATPARDQPLIIEITTNGFVRDNFFDNQYDYASGWLSGKVEDDHFLPVIYELDDRTEWTDESKWLKANPGLGTIKKVEALRGYVNKAKQDPSFLPTVLTKDFNLPENKASSWLRYDEAVNRATFDWHEKKFRYCVIGYDASDSIDLTAAQALMMVPGDDHIYEMSMYWIPEEALEKRIRAGKRSERDSVPYTKWIEDGLIRKVPGNKIDHRVIFEWMNELRDEYDVWPFALGYDPWHLTDDSWQSMAESFVGKKRLEPIRWGAKTLSMPMKQIRADYEAHRIIDNDNPVNQWNRMNVAVTIDRNDNYLPCKGNGATGRIDGFAAELCAYIALQRHWDEYTGSI